MLYLVFGMFLKSEKKNSCQLSRELEFLYDQWDEQGSFFQGLIAPYNLLNFQLDRNLSSSDIEFR
jgi:hypothetical protein